MNLDEDSFCNISPYSDLAALLRISTLIIWDEAPMMHQHCFESLDRSLRDIIPSSIHHGKPFGGKVVIFGGDFRQILPVIPRSLDVQVQNLDATKQFVEWILKIGDGVIGEPNDGEGIVKIPNDILIQDTENPIFSIVSAIYPSFEKHLNEPSYFQDRAILVPTNEEVDCINDYMMDELSGEAKIYLSSYSICQTELGGYFHPSLYTPEILNGIKVSGLPHHKLTLKVSVPLVLLRNIDQPNVLCNGTRLQVLKLGQHVIETKIISGTNVGKVTIIHRMKLIPSDKRISFRLQRSQFPIVVCFTMTINKSQGQSLSQVGLFLQRSIFTHGQLYVAISRVKSKAGLKVFIRDKDGKLSNKTTNVVYKEVL